MLDEKLEYEQYTFDLSGSDGKTVTRIKYNPLVRNELAGLSRPLTVIARHFLSLEPQITNMHDREIADRKLIHALKVWCGFEKPEISDDNEVKKLYGWLPGYMRRLMTAAQYKVAPGIHTIDIDLSGSSSFRDYINNLTCAKTDEEYISLCKEIRQIYPDNEELGMANNIAKTLMLLKKKDKEWSESQIMEQGSNKDGGKESNTSKPKNSMNRITYEKIIGNAIRRGPLETYYLGCRKNLIKECINIKSNGTTGTLTKNQRDYILKQTANCMLKMTHFGACQVTNSIYVAVNDTDLVNWSLLAKMEVRRHFYYRGKPLFPEINETELGSAQKKNFLQIRLNQEWLDDCGWCILKGFDEIKEFYKKYPKGTVFKDQGAGLLLIDVPPKPELS